MAESNYNRESELKALDESKSGVKGVVDGGNLVKIPRIFIHEQQRLHKYSTRSSDSKVSIPVVDVGGLTNDIEDGSKNRGRIIDQVGDACEKWGFFQVVNHGIPESVLEAMIDGVRGFHEQDAEVKKSFYTRDAMNKKVVYNTNFDLYQTPATQWRDTLTCVVAPCRPDPQDLPAVCRYVIISINMLFIYMYF